MIIPIRATPSSPAVINHEGVITIQQDKQFLTEQNDVPVASEESEVIKEIWRSKQPPPKSRYQRERI